MPWSALQRLIGSIAWPLSRLIVWYARLIAVFTILRLLRHQRHLADRSGQYLRPLLVYASGQ